MSVVALLDLTFESACGALFEKHGKMKNVAFVSAFSHSHVSVI